MRKILTALLFSVTTLLTAQTQVGDSSSPIYHNNGNVGIGTQNPSTHLDVKGSLTLDNGNNPTIFGGSENYELNRYLELLNSNSYKNAMGLKAGGILVANSYSYANPGKSDLIVEGKIGIGTSSLTHELTVNGAVKLKEIVIDNGNDPNIFGSSDTTEQNRYLRLLTSKSYQSAMGFKAGGILVADSYGYANPGKNDLIVKGNVGIGITSPTHKLTVNGTIRAKEVIVDNNNWPDYVFKADYNLKELSEVQDFINKNGHLPDVPSAQNVHENGVSLAELNATLLQKVEELTLYIIMQQEQMDDQQKQIDQLISDLQ